MIHLLHLYCKKGAHSNFLCFLFFVALTSSLQHSEHIGIGQCADILDRRLWYLFPIILSLHGWVDIISVFFNSVQYGSKILDMLSGEQKLSGKEEEMLGAPVSSEVIRCTTGRWTSCGWCAWFQESYFWFARNKQYQRTTHVLKKTNREDKFNLCAVRRPAGVSLFDREDT